MRSVKLSRQKSPPPRQPVQVVQAGADEGLTSEQVQARQAAGWSNLQIEAPTRTVGQIVRDNTCTFFNLIFAVLAVLLVLVDSCHNMLFLVIAVANTVIGILQQLRSKRAIDRLNLLYSPGCTVIRNGTAAHIPTDQVVRDDVAEFSAGNQIPADALLLSGQLQVNEALVTGEADTVEKGPGDTLLSGSFAVAGRCRARLTQVGPDSFAARLTLEAKREFRAGKSEMMAALDKLIRVIGILLIPVGILLFLKQFYLLQRPLQPAVVSTVAALVGMIPEGLYLLTSVALAVGVLRLAREKVLVQEMSCIETLARVDVLCVDKTGTITAPEMEVRQVIPLAPEGTDLHPILGALCQAVDAGNDTARALGHYFPAPSGWQAMRVLPFTPERKWSAAVFPQGAFVIGAPDRILNTASLQAQVQSYSAQGCRVLLAAEYLGDPMAGALQGECVRPLALILLSNPIRPEAAAVFRYFAAQGVTIKVLSGDNPVTASYAAQQAGIPDAGRWADASALEEDALLQAAPQTTVFGRVTPGQKRSLIRALQQQGHTVAMTGDGVNDVLALKDANCGIAMASGSDAACHAAQIVLLDSDFSAMPKVVGEGRRVIQNIQRSASLFLVKNIFSFSLAVLSLLIAVPYPFVPIQMSMISGLTIGIPAFFLALEPNHTRVQGSFLRNVLQRALPGGLTGLTLILLLELTASLAGFSEETLSTLSTILLAVVGLLILFQVCRPFTRRRWLIWGGMVLLVVGAVTVARPIFSLSRLSLSAAVVLLVFLLLAFPALQLISRLMQSLFARLSL
ncbi:MAG: HAD-IC family P-type ATPase [Oscillospiraceae bacterium]|nr:HAD-IC family P-type ATPase [Oscillospiraceae bacterium]